MEQASAKAGWVVPTVDRGLTILVIAVIAATCAALWLARRAWEQDADRRACRKRERVEAGVARSVARAARDAGRGGR